MLKYLDKAENEINTAEPVNVEPDTLAIQLHDHQVEYHWLNRNTALIFEIKWITNYRYEVYQERLCLFVVI